jgi:protein-tyrosine phosphatase
MQNNKVKILFVCHGNICRSPMAERVMKHLVAEAGMGDKFEIDSAAMRTDAIGCSMYSPAKRELEAHGISGEGHVARLMSLDDYDYYDLIVGMDDENERDIMRLTKNDPQNKFRLMMSFAGMSRGVADPWYTRNFTETWDDVNIACAEILSSYS